MLDLKKPPLSKDEEFSRILVLFGSGWVAGLGLLLALLNWLETSSPMYGRGWVDLSAGILGLVTLVLGMRGRWQAGAYVLVWGIWLFVVTRAAMTGGMRSNNHIGFSVILVMSGWALGVRPTLAILLATLAVMVGFKLLNEAGYMPTHLPATWSYLVYFVGMMVLSAGSTLLARRFFLSRAADAEAAANRLRLSEQELRQFSLAVEQCPASILIVNMQERVVYANLAFLRSSGYTMNEVLGQPAAKVSTSGMDEEVRRQARLLLSQGLVWQGDLRNHRKDGSVVIEDVRIASLHDGLGLLTHFVELKQDITDRVQAEATIHQLSNYDRITGLPNRFAFLKRLMELKDLQGGKSCHSTQCPRHALLVLDVDRFTGFNDVHGSVQGDQLLRAVALRLTSLLPPTGLLVRTSADEFGIVIENLATQIEDAEVLTQAYADRLMETLDAEPLWLDALHDAVRVTCCIGMSVFPDIKNDSEIEALRRANTALHEAKNRGPGHAVIFQEVMAENASRRYRIEKGLRRAVGEGELRLFLQGQFNAQGRPVGAEALVRWEHPERGLMAPGLFIPVAEESDLIVLLGDWVLEQACRLLVNPLIADNRLLLSVNVSARQFLQADFAPKLRELLAFTGADPSLLTLEVTEGLVLSDFDEAAKKMTLLRELGIQFALDDFGTGYSSMAYLKRLPIQELKIDQSFVRDVHNSTHSEALVEAILWVAHRFGLRVVAEGVETREQAELLHAWEPNILCQGFFHDRPIPSEDWLQTYAEHLASPRAGG